MYATVHMDIKPMAFIHTSGTLLDGAKTYRHWAAFDADQGKVVRAVYELE